MKQDNSLSIALSRQLASRLFGLPIHVGRNDFIAFASAVYAYRRARHFDYIVESLLRVVEYVESGGERGVGRLMISVPPQHGKSLHVSKLLPSWFLGRNPRKRVMLVSYGQDLANENSRFVRGVIASEEYRAIFGDLRLDPSSRAVNMWSLAGTQGEGGVTAVGVGGPATGKGAHLLIIDDPIKNYQEAMSETYRKMVWNSYHSDYLTRLRAGGAVVLMSTRWHEDDLQGRLLKAHGGEWTVINLPARAEEGDLLGRAVGEYLWTEQYSVSEYFDRQQKQTPYVWAALYQGQPKPVAGNILKEEWFLPAVYVYPPVFNRVVRYWDLAMSTSNSADYTVGLKVGLAEDGTRWVLDVRRVRVELADLPGVLIDTVLHDGVTVHQGFEYKGYMTRAIQQVVKSDRLRGHVMKGYNPEGDKITRVLPAAGRASMGVYRLVVGDWVGAFIDEITSFPNGAHDDQIDAFSGADMMLDERNNDGFKVRAFDYV